MSDQKLCDEIAADAAGLMAMPASAPERQRAEEHARGHAPCARALDEARQLLALISASPPPAPSTDALSRASAAVLSFADREAAGRAGMAVFAAVIAAWTLPLALMKAPLESGVPFTVSLGLAVLAAVSSGATILWSRRAAAAFPALSVLAALGAGRGSELLPAVGLHCASIEAMTALGCGVGGWLLARAARRRQLTPAPGASSLEVAAVGGGALAGHAALHLGCSAAHELPHLLVFHTGPVVLAVGLASLLARAAARRAVAARA